MSTHQYGFPQALEARRKVIKETLLAGFWLTPHLPRTNKTAIRLAGKQDLLIIPRING